MKTNEEPILQKRIGIRIGSSLLLSFRMSLPFAKLLLYNNRLKITYIFGNVELLYSEIDYVNPFFSFLQIHHHNSTKPKFIVISRALNDPEVVNILKKKGVKVKL